MNQTEISIVSPYSRPERLFLHYFDIHFIEEKGASAISSNFLYEMRLATRIAVASAETVFIPAASYFESKLCRQIIGELNELFPLGIIALSGSSPNLDCFVQERLNIGFYRENSIQNNAYHSLFPQNGEEPPYVPRQRSATQDIVNHWNDLVQDNELQLRLRDTAGIPIPNIETRLERVPKELGALAFIPEHVYEILDLAGVEKPLHMRIRSAINEAYFASYTQDLATGVIVDLRYLSSSFLIPSFGQNISYMKMMGFLRKNNRLKEVENCTPDQLVRFGNDPNWQIALQSAVTYVGQPSTALASIVSHSSAKTFAFSNEGNKEQSMVQKYPLSNDSPVLPEQSSRLNTVLCLTIAAVEFESVRSQLKKAFGNGKIVYLDTTRQFYAIEYSDPNSETIWHLASLSFQGETEAAVGINRFCNFLKPTIVLMVGMCMGMPKKDLSVGTVVIPNEIFVFDHQRLTPNGNQHRPHGNRVDNGLYNLAKLIASESELGFPVVVNKALASASIKIEDVNSALVKQIENSFPDVVAYDMEGWGFYLAGEGRHCLWVKAVADSGEHQSQSALGQIEKNKTQSSATDNAADFAIHLVQNFVSASPASKT